MHNTISVGATCFVFCITSCYYSEQRNIGQSALSLVGGST